MCCYIYSSSLDNHVLHSLIMAQFQNCAVQFILRLALACLHGEIRMLSSLYLIIVTCSNEVHAYLAMTSLLC